MKVFISSVRRGLEDERDALPAMILALGHEAIRFEDFTAQAVPPREACMRGVEAADAYVLLLGSQYGDPMPDTGVAPTEEEFNVARRRAIPVLVFAKRGPAADERQAAFVRRVEDYATGEFRASFGSTADLLPAVTRALAQLARRPVVLSFGPVSGPVTVPWRNTGRGGWASGGSMLEVHAVAVPPVRLTASALDALPAVLARAARDTGFFTEGQALDLRTTVDAAEVVTQGDRRDLAGGVRVSPTGAVSAWQQMPSDALGVILDERDLAQRVAAILRLEAAFLPTEGKAGLAIGLFGLWNATEGSVAELGRRTSAAMNPGAAESATSDVRDTVAVRAIASSADEIARELAKRLVLAFRQTTGH